MARILQVFTGVKKAMTERTCGNCRWWQYDRPWANKQVGQCRQSASALPEVYNTDFCGQWADKTITPEQEERREQVRRFAVAIVSGDDEATGARYKPSTVWMMAEQLADAEPKSGGAK